MRMFILLKQTVLSCIAKDFCMREPQNDVNMLNQLSAIIV